MRRTASSTICFHERSSRFGTGRDMGEAPKRRDSAARQVEGKDQVVDAVGGADLVAHVDQDPLRAVRVGQGLHLDVADSELVFGERLFYVVPDQRLRGGVVRRKDEVVDAAPPLRPHLPLAQRGADDDAHRLLDVGLVPAELDGAVRPHGEGKLEADAEEIAHRDTRMRARLCGRDRHFHYPLAVGTGHDRSTLPFLDLESVGGVALGTDEPAGASRIDGLDDLVPDRFESGQAIFGVLIHFRQSPLIRRTGASQPALNPEEACSREADPYLARWGAIKPPPGRGVAVASTSTWPWAAYRL